MRRSAVPVRRSAVSVRNGVWRSARAARPLAVSASISMLRNARRRAGGACSTAPAARRCPPWPRASKDPVTAAFTVSQAAAWRGSDWRQLSKRTRSATATLPEDSSTIQSTADSSSAGSTGAVMAPAVTPRTA